MLLWITVVSLLLLYESSLRMRLKGNTMWEATPNISPIEIGPYFLESTEHLALSPSTQQWPLGMMTVLPRSLTMSLGVANTRLMTQSLGSLGEMKTTMSPRFKALGSFLIFLAARQSTKTQSELKVFQIDDNRPVGFLGTSSFNVGLMDVPLTQAGYPTTEKVVLQMQKPAVILPKVKPNDFSLIFTTLWLFRTGKRCA